MPIFSDSVPRDLYDRKCAEYDALLKLYHELRVQGANTPIPPKPGRVVAPVDHEAVAAQKMHEDLLDSLETATKNIERDFGVPPDKARQAARELREAIHGRGGVP